MSVERTGREWYFGIEQLTTRLDGTLRIDDQGLLSIDENDRETEKIWISGLRARTPALISKLIQSLDEISADEKAKRSVASLIVTLADLCISAGAYHPWVGKLKAIKEDIATEAGLKEGNAGSQKRQAKIATEGLVRKTDMRREIAQKVAAGAPRKSDGKAQHPKKLLEAVNRELAAKNLKAIESTRTLRRYLNQ